jgi:hypothetical protein
MNPWNLPFQRWPLRHHLLLAILAVAAVGLGLQWWLAKTQSSLDKHRLDLLALQGQMGGQQAGTQPTARVDFTHHLPSLSRSHEVVNDISRFAQSEGVLITSMAVSPQAASVVDLGKVNFDLSATAEYKAAKAWLAELLGRYPSLGIQSMSMRAQASDPAKLEVRLSLVLFVKD